MSSSESESLAAAIESRFAEAYELHASTPPDARTIQFGRAIMKQFGYEVVCLDASARSEIPSSRVVIMKPDLYNPGAEMHFGDDVIDFAYTLLEVPRQPGDQRDFESLPHEAIDYPYGRLYLVDKRDRAFALDTLVEEPRERLVQSIYAGRIVLNPPSWLQLRTGTDEVT